MHEGPWFPRLALFFAVIPVVALLVSAQTTVPSAASSQEVIQGMDAAVKSREAIVSGYTVKDHYAIYRNGDPNPSAEMTVQTTYKRGSGKTFTTLSESGSGLLRSTVIHKIIESEKEMSLSPVRETVLLNSANYEITPEPNEVQLNGHACRIVDLKARQKNPHLFNGKAWLDATDYTIVRLEGSPSQAPSFFAGDSTVARDYSKIEGLAMATHAEAHSHSFLLGNTILKIDSTDYQIQRNP
jgi:hypothetical protein